MPQLITRWASQAGRTPLALSPERARLDVRGFAGVLAEAAHLGGLVAFRDEDTDADWRTMLGADPAVSAALLATFDLDTQSEGLRALIARARSRATARQAQTLIARLVRALILYANEIDQWLAPAEAAGGRSGHAAFEAIEDVVERELAPQLGALLDEIAVLEAAERLTDVLPRDLPLSERWRAAVFAATAEAVRDDLEQVWLDRLLDRVADVAEAFVSRTGLIADGAAAALAANLARDDHAPQVALTMAFAQVFGHVQTQLNAVPGRLVEFYHGEVLRAAPAPARPDTVLLALVAAPGTRLHVPQGARFGAGKEVAFAADHAIDLTGAAVHEVRIWTPASGEPHILAPGPDGVLVGASPGLSVVPATIIESPLLVLPAGTRRITLTLHCTGLTAAAPQLASGIGVELATAKGWLALADAGTTPIWAVADQTITLAVDLTEDAPPLAALDGTPGPGALRLYLRQAAGWGSVTLADAALSIAVKNASGLVVDTPSAHASTTGAAPFGTPPAVGGWLRIDHPVLANTPLDRLVLRLEWAGLPADPHGFAGYYRDYVIDGERRLRNDALFTNASFGVTLAAPVPGWDPARVLPLFQSPAQPAPDVFAADAAEWCEQPPPSPDGPVAPLSWFAGQAVPGGNDVLYKDVTLTLATPADGFGESLYLANVARATAVLGRAALPRRHPGLLPRAAAAIVAWWKGLMVKLHLRAPPVLPAPVVARPPTSVLPNPPFRPLLSGVWLDYAVSATRDALLVRHEGAFDTAQPVGAGTALFPPLPAQPMIDIGLTRVTPGTTLTLLIQIGTLGATRQTPPVWSYWTAAGWCPLPPAALFADGTDGLETSGIVALTVPADAATQGPASLWLRIVADPPPGILMIAPDALTATRIMAEPGGPVVPIAPGTINAFPGGARVVQPLASMGGRAAEDVASLQRRVTERTSHRGRGLTARDIEALVLADFPEIAKVRALPGAGAVTVIVMPAQSGDDAAPPRSPAGLLGAITTRLRAVTSPFAQIAVVDPVYVAIDVAAQVRVIGDGAAAVTAGMAALLSPWAEPGLALDDGADVESVRTAIASVLAAIPGVVAIDRLQVTLGNAGPGAWLVPVAGAIDIVTVVAGRRGPPW